MKKALKIFGIIILAALIVLISVPFFFKGTVQDKVRHLINQHVNAKVDFANVDISLLRSFPKASVIIEELSVINYAPFEGDTLIYTKKIALNVAVNQLFKSASEPINVKRIAIDQASIAIKKDSLGNSNLDITKNKTTDQIEEKVVEQGGEDFSFDFEHYEINDSKILYLDQVSKTNVFIDHLNHRGDGTVSGDKIILDTIRRPIRIRL